jgi:hypothetical protein
MADSSTYHLQVFFLADYAQCPLAQELPLHKLIAVLPNQSPLSLINTIDLAYKHKIPPSTIGKNLKALLLDEVVSRSEDMLRMDEFNELLEQGGAFARDFVQALKENHKSSTNPNKMIAKHMGSTSLSCFCWTCKFTFIVPARSIVFAFGASPKCPSCSDNARTRMDSHVSVWTCPSATCDYTFYAAPLGKPSTTFTCPKCTYVGVPGEWKVQAD